MTSTNNRTNELVKWVIILGDFLLLNGLLALYRYLGLAFTAWPDEKVQVFWVVCNLAMVLATSRFMTIIHLHVVSASDILKRVVGLILLHFLLSYFILKIIDLQLQIGWMVVRLDLSLGLLIIVKRLIERNVIKRLRLMGHNTRMVTFIGADEELDNLYNKLIKNPTTGYRVVGYYADEEREQAKHEGIQRMGTIHELMERVEANVSLDLGEEIYVCLSRSESFFIRELADYCDRHVVRFYFVPTSMERMGMRMQREYIEDIEVFTTHDFPLGNPANWVMKTVFDKVMAFCILLCCLPFFPVIALIIKLQSAGPVFFKQLRTGLNGDNFECYKFRSMAVNLDADKLQATEDDPRKFPFGNFMRKYNLDELPQFWNVLIGNMSVVGPRPHMLAHTEMYSSLIKQYMVRHFVKPGITGWAQVTGFRGETKELWQMEERVKRDIWYMDHWSVWLDIRIIWMTVKSVFIHDEKAY